jgi:predicted amidohydrolase YtcJ
MCRAKKSRQRQPPPTGALFGLHVASVRRLSKLGAVVATNPSFIYYSGERYLTTVPSGQMSHLYAIKDMLKAGLNVAGRL